MTVLFSYVKYPLVRAIYHLDTLCFVLDDEK